jgi:hypothetical protein
MTVDKRLRTLVGLSTASSSRVLNLTKIAQAQSNNKQHLAAPFFVSPVLNSSIILKHRLRPDEEHYFPEHRALVTKVVIPFQKTNLGVGGRSFFVGEPAYEGFVREQGTYANESDLKRDLDVLRMLDGVPSLDPFLLREHLARGGITPDACYFAISDADQKRMFDYATQEIGKLTAMATGNLGTTSSGRIVAAMLANELDQTLDPLRQTLNLNATDFTEGIFAWRGFLYYKWSLDGLWPQLLRVIRSFNSVRIKGAIDRESSAAIAATKRAIAQGVKQSSDSIRQSLATYDHAYSRLIDAKNPADFREFLLKAPSLFLEIGEKVGGLSHVASFWNYRFPNAMSKSAEPDELIVLFSDFAQSLGIAVA